MKKFNEMIKKYKKYEAYADCEIKVKYVINLFEEEVYVEVELHMDEEEKAEYTQIIEFTSKAKAYNEAQAIAKELQKQNINANYSKEIYN
jgi:hypothetical protein